MSQITKISVDGTVYDLPAGGAGGMSSRWISSEDGVLTLLDSTACCVKDALAGDVVVLFPAASDAPRSFSLHFVAGDALSFTWPANVSFRESSDISSYESGKGYALSFQEVDGGVFAVLPVGSSVKASDVLATEKVDGVDVQTTVQARLDDTASDVSSVLSAVAANKDALAKKADLVDGVVPASQLQLPSFVDDVLEYASSASFPTTGEAGKIYVALDTNLTYRWGGSKYVEISKSLALGETAETAYAGDKGKAASDAIAAHEARTDNPHGVTAKQLSLAAVATSGKYTDLTDTPTIPTTLTDLTNATTGGYITSNQAYFDTISRLSWHGKEVEFQKVSLPQSKGLNGCAILLLVNKDGIVKMQNAIDATFATKDEPVFTAWRDGSSVKAGLYALAPNEYNTAVGMEATVGEKDADGASVVSATALGANSYTATSGSLAVAQTPDAILLNSKTTDSGASAKTLQAYLNEKADATDLSTLSKSVSTLSAKVDDANAALEEVA